MIEEIYEEDNARYVVLVKCSDITSETAILATFDELDEALTKILEKAKDHDIYFHSIGLRCDGIEPRLGLFDPFMGEFPYEGDLGHVPWADFCPEFWDNARRTPATRERVKAWATRVQGVLRTAEQYQRSTESLWQEDEVQFGEPILTHLALSDVEFVPFYSRVLQLWDLGHEVEQSAEVNEIIEAHGICPATEELIYVRVALNPGQHGPDLLDDALPALEEHFGSFTDSRLFRRIVTAEFAERMARAGYFEFSNYSMFSHADDVIREGAERVYAELNKAAGIVLTDAD